MGVQQARRSKARTRTRRSAILKLDAPNIMECPKCHEFKQSHRVCPACGFYDGREVVKQAE